MEIRPENFGKARLVVNYLMLGDVNVGKSSLLLRFADKSFNSNPLTTIGIENRNVNLKVDDKPVTLQSTNASTQSGTPLGRKSGGRCRPVTIGA